MGKGMFQQLIDLLIEAFKNLGADVSLMKTEELAIMVHKAMTVQSRSYHTTEHVLNLSDSSEPLHTLAAIFHDIVYYQVDTDFSSEIYDIISPYIREEENEIRIARKIPEDDRLFMLTLDIFDFEQGQRLSLFAGLNEFLSTLCMNKKLEGILPEKELLQISVCIEGTIPFRGNNEKGQSCFDILEQRLCNIIKKYNFSITAREREQIVKSAVVFSNKDVEGFSEEEPGKFLDNTWKLLPESNVPLRSKHAYSIRDYRLALQKMEFFLCNLNLDNVFHAYKGVPSAKEFKQKNKAARRNIYIARNYLVIKLLAMAILEALAEMTGGDAPLSLFMGDIKTKENNVKRLEDYLPELKQAEPAGSSSTVLTLLDVGRASESSFDMKNSPISAFLYKNLGQEKINQLAEKAKQMFSGKLDAQKFFNAVDKPVASAIANACASMVATRREKLLQYTL
ncbi:MAG: hypothetical protein GY795_00080 [Desulfobacterales bacterium]|nr:hypothetical protein [Desulfobacterales bacterium]